MKPWAIFLGGRDLEMVEIAKLVAGRADTEVYDRQLPWGATASAYTAELRAALDRGRSVAVVELPDDLPADVPRERITWVDHHGALAGADRPTSIEQVFTLLEFAPDQWTRDLSLVAANDRGHIRALRAAGATLQEIVAIRARDRQAQGITAAEEAEGRAAAGHAETRCAGRLTVVRLPHARTATVTDVLDAGLGGPGYANLVVFCPSQTAFFGSGRCIDALRKSYPDGWHGGELPERGYWSCARSLAESEILPRLETAIVTKPAAEIVAPVYRQILFWPLILKHQPATDKVSRQLDEWLTVLKPNWGDPVPSLPKSVSPPMGDDVTFEEIVYFHPFVRDFLFGDGDPTGDRTLRRLKRSDVSAVKVESAKDGPILTLTVARLELYLCKPLVALMVIEVHQPKWPGDAVFTLADALNLQSQLRQVHPPFFLPWGPAGNCPHAVTFVTDAGEVRSDFDAGRDHFARFTHSGAEPPVAAHWQALLAPLKPFPGSLKDEHGHYTPEGTGLFYQQIEDDRMPGMTFLTVPNPREVTEGDYDRLTWCDTPGERKYPYSGDFLALSRQKHQYDRFWDGRVATPPDDYDTRYLCSGYQLVMVGRDDNPDIRNFLWDHFRRHYFWMGLILHCQRSVLLKFQDDLGEAVKLISGQSTDKEWSNPQFRERVAYIQMTFLKFRTRAGFTEVSNQLQGRELFAWWMGQLGTDKLFNQVDVECQRLHSGLAEHESRQITKAQMELAKAQAQENKELKELAYQQANLALIAQWGLGASIVLSTVSVFVNWVGLFPDGVKHFFPGKGDFIYGPWVLLVFTAVLSVIAAWLVRRIFQWVVKKSPPKAKQL